MSYDAMVIEAPCQHCGAGRRIDIGNITSNVGDMYRTAMPECPEGGGRYNGTGAPEKRNGLTGLSGLPGAVAANHMRAGLAFMEGNRDVMLALEPGNGWGSYRGAVKYLRKCLEACESAPDGVFCVNW